MKNVSDKIDDSKNPHKLQQQVKSSEYRYKQKEIEIRYISKLFFNSLHVKFRTIETLTSLTLGHCHSFV